MTQRFWDTEETDYLTKTVTISCVSCFADITCQLHIERKSKVTPILPWMRHGGVMVTAWFLQQIETITVCGLFYIEGKPNQAKNNQNTYKTHVDM